MIPSLLFRTFYITAAMLLLQYGAWLIYGVASSSELQTRVADAVEMRQTWRVHHSNSREVFTCLLCGHAVQSASGHGVHKDAYSCLQCNHTSFASECNATLPHKHYAFQVELVIGSYDVPSPLHPLLRFILTTRPVSFHPVSALCAAFSLALFGFYLHHLCGVFRLVAQERDKEELRRLKASLVQEPSVQVNSNEKERFSFNNDAFGDLRQRVPVSFNS